MDAKNNVAFENALAKWVAFHLKNSKGERKRRLTNGLGHAERLFLLLVWWPAFGNFVNLIPEYEVRDFNDGARFIDFAYVTGDLMIAVEIDGFGSHWRNADRWKFADHLMRQNYLLIDGWKMLRFSYDDISEKPRRCEQVLQQAFGKWVFSAATRFIGLSAVESAILHWADTADAPLTPIKAAAVLGMHRKTAARHFKSLVSKGVFSAAAAHSQRVMRYLLNSKA